MGLKISFYVEKAKVDENNENQNETETDENKIDDNIAFMT